MYIKYIAIHIYYCILIYNTLCKMEFLFTNVRVVIIDFGVYVYKFFLTGKNFIMLLLIIVEVQYLVKLNMLEKIKI